MQLEDFMECIEAGEIPPEPPDGLTGDGFEWNGPLENSYSYGDYLRARTVCIEKGMWALVERQWTTELARWIGTRRILEIMAGRGWLAKALAEHGIRIIATDDGSWDDSCKGAAPVFDVQRLAAVEAVRTFNEQADILLVSWPPCGDTVICRAAEEWGERRPIIYIGEFRGGRNAPEKFFNAFQLIDGLKFSLKSWHGFYDAAYAGYYKPTTIPG
ncbi:MAG: hypothetical protein U1F76_16985 [Candidatus Competibacteraceae bacterium]